MLLWEGLVCRMGERLKQLTSSQACDTGFGGETRLNFHGKQGGKLKYRGRTGNRGEGWEIEGRGFPLLNFLGLW